MSELRKLIHNLENDKEGQYVGDVADFVVNNIPKIYPVLHLDPYYPTKKLMDFNIHHKRYVKIYYGKKILIFENEKDKTMFLLKYGE